MDRELLDRASRIPLPDFDCFDDEFEEAMEAYRGTVIDEFKFLGQGGARSVWRGPDGMAYKIPLFRNCTQQERELHLADSLRHAKLPYWLHIPTFQYDDVTQILVTEVIDGFSPTLWSCQPEGSWDFSAERRVPKSDAECHCGLRPCIMTRFVKAEELTGLCDLHEGNVMCMPLSRKSFYRLAIIDLGM